jgi:hypothetical protein
MTAEQQKRVNELAARNAAMIQMLISDPGGDYSKSVAMTDAAELRRLLAPETPGQRIVRESLATSHQTNEQLAEMIDAAIRAAAEAMRERCANRIEPFDGYYAEVIRAIFAEDQP